MNMYDKFGHTSVALKTKNSFPEGTKIRINHLNGENSSYDGKEGVVTMIDDMGNLHGTWGGLSIIPEEDDFTVIS